MRQNRIDVAVATRPVNSTLDLRFADNVRRNLYPSTFTNYSELLAYLNYLHQQGLTKDQIEERVRIKTARDFSYAKGKGFSLNTRRMAELIPQGLIDHIGDQEAAGRIPEGTLQRYIDDVYRTWNDSSKRSWELTQNGLGYWENGHWIAAKDINSIGPTTGRNANPELKNNFLDITGVEVKGNTGHSNSPRANMSIEDARTVGIPTNWLEDFYEFLLRDPVLNGTGVNMGAGLGRPLTDAEAMRLDSRTVTPGQLVAQVRLENELKAQGVTEKPNINLTKAGKVTTIRPATFPNVSRSTRRIDLPDNYGNPTTSQNLKISSSNASAVTPRLTIKPPANAQIAKHTAGVAPPPRPSLTITKPAAKHNPAPVNPANKPLQGGILNAIPDFISAAQKGDAGGMFDAVAGGVLESVMMSDRNGRIIHSAFNQSVADGTLEGAIQRGDFGLRIPKQKDLTPEQWSSYKAGGGDAKLRQGLTINQVILQGRKNK
jgi:hypothetical protein